MALPHKIQLSATVAFAAALIACEDGSSPDRWRDLGELPAAAATALNHTPLVVSGDRILVGTNAGIWSRPVDGSGTWAQAGLPGVGIFATRRHPAIEATVFAAGQPTDDPGPRRSIGRTMAEAAGSQAPPSHATASTARPNRSSISRLLRTIPNGFTPIFRGRPSPSRLMAVSTGRSQTAKPRSSSAILA